LLNKSVVAAFCKLIWIIKEDVACLHLILMFQEQSVRLVHRASTDLCPIPSWSWQEQPREVYPCKLWDLTKV